MNDIFPDDKQPLRVNGIKFLKRNLIFLPTFGTIVVIGITWLLNKFFYVRDPINKFLFFIVLLTLIGTDIMYICLKEIPGLIPGSIVRGKFALIIVVIELVLVIFIGFYFIVIIQGG